MALSDIATYAGRLVSQASDEAARVSHDIAGRISGSTVRLGVTGLSRAGKTVFITALVHNLTQRGWLPFFEPVAEERLLSASILPPAPHLDLFDFQRYFAQITAQPGDWPQRTNSLSEIRIALSVRPRSDLAAMMGPRTITLEIVDYPGEWLLDLPLLNQSFGQWSQEALALARRPERSEVARPFLDYLSAVEPGAPLDLERAQTGSTLFKQYLAGCRDARHALSTLPPGRFLEPGDARNAPMLNFMPLDLQGADARFGAGSMGEQMNAWFEAYKAKLVRPFFSQHFSSIDRQIVLVDLLRALNTGPAAVEDLRRALTQILTCFRTGENSIVSRFFAPKVERVLFAATKADHLHASSYDRLEAIMRMIVADAADRAQMHRAAVDVAAIAAVRATRQARVRKGGTALACITGTPLAGENIEGQTYDGTRPAVIYPGTLPDNAATALEKRQNIRFVRFRPPPHSAYYPLAVEEDQMPAASEGAAGSDPAASDGSDAAAGALALAGPPALTGTLPHIRLDRALQFLLGDKLQ